MKQITIALLSAGFVVLFGSKTGKSRVSCFSSYTSSIPETTTRAAVNMGTKTVGKARPIKTKTKSVPLKTMPICGMENCACIRVKHSPHKMSIKPSRPPATQARTYIDKLVGRKPGKYCKVTEQRAKPTGMPYARFFLSERCVPLFIAKAVKSMVIDPASRLTSHASVT